VDETVLTNRNARISHNTLFRIIQFI